MVKKSAIASLATTLLAAVLATAASAQIQSQGPVSIDTGRVAGALTGQSNTISVYKGIPYVAPPIGDLRWRPPQPAKPWTGVREATTFSPIPLQRDSPQPQSEDSLYLNVWTPAKNGSERRAVMFWIYGGGFTYGSSSTPLYDGTRLAEHGVVVVSFNYRLNVLSGFAHPLLSKESGHGSGNYGLLDQVAALQWVRRNVKAFGGDPDNVTIFGESAGGLSVSALLVSPMAKGLFHKAIIESGSGAQLTTIEAAEAAGQQMVTRMGLANDADLPSTLRSKAWKEFPDAINYRGGPVQDGWAFPVHPKDAWATGAQANVPMIVGYNHDEATFFVGRDGPLPTTLDAFQQSVRQRFGALAEQIFALYPAKMDEEAYWAEVAIRTDARMGVSARQQLRGMFNVTAKTWAYHFSFLPDVVRDPRRGVSHAAELAYVFGTIPGGSDPATRDMSEAIMKYWTQFAKTGNPNQPGLPAWPPFGRGNEAYLELGRPIHADKDLNKQKLDLLESVPRPRPTPSTGAR